MGKKTMAYMNNSQQKKDLLMDMPIDSRASKGSAMPMMGSSISKHMTTPTHMMGSLKGKGSAMMMKGAMKGDQSKSRLDYESPAKMGAKKGDQSKSRLDYEGSPAKKTKSRIEQDLGRNIAADKKAGKNKDAKAEAKQLMKVADGSQRY